MHKNKIKETNEIYNRAIVGGDFGIWEWNLKLDTFFLSKQCYSILGYTDQELKNLYGFIDRFVLSEDKKLAIDDLNFFINENKQYYRSEVRILTNNKKVKWVVIKGKFTNDTEGNRNLLSGSINGISTKKELENKINTLAYYDVLTELPNRTLFIKNLKSVINECKNNGNKAALIFIDIDNFKFINDTFGYECGDLLLKLLSQDLQLCNNDYCNTFRLNGDEFIILANKVSSKDEVTIICNKIMDICNNPFELMGEKVYISVSIGIAFLPKDSLDINDAYKYADMAMYQSKIKGKNKVTFFEKSILNTYSRRLVIEQELKTAIENKEFFIVYQPQIDMLHNKIIGFEALLRWNSNKLGNVSPAEFIPISEKCGIIVEIGEWVINSVCNKINELCEKGCDFECISVNISPVQLKRIDFISTLTNIMEDKKISPTMLEIEITEGTLIDLHKDNLDIFDDIIEKGIKIALDDFGTGYSSLNYLTILPISTLKIDKTFINGIDNEKNMIVIDFILNLSKALNYKVVAEGVETEFQMNKLLRAGSNIIQGHYFSKPVPEEEIELLLLNTYNSKE